METLEEEQAKIPYPTEIIEEIVSRLPVKSILRFRSVSKPWLSLISGSAFTKLHFKRATVDHRTALFMSTYDESTNTRHFFSGAHDGGQATYLMKLENDPYSITDAEHLNGLVCFTSANSPFGDTHAFVFNPSTRKFLKLPDPVCYQKMDMCYLLGFDESRNEHKVLNIRTPDARLIKPTNTKIMIFSFSNYSWRKIDVNLPTDISWARWPMRTRESRRSVCVNSVMHLMLRDPLQILAFDLRTEKFSIVKIPLDVVGPENTSIDPSRCFVKINGLLGVVCHDHMDKGNKMDIWILQDYEKRVWVKETIRFPEPRINMRCPFPLDSGNMDEIIFSPSILSGNLISVLIYDMKSRYFKSTQFTLGHPFLRSEVGWLDQIASYVESLIPLQY